MQSAHGFVGVTDVVVGYHHEATMFALRVNRTDLPKGREESTKLVVLDVTVDVSHKEGSGWVLPERVLSVMLRDTRRTGATGGETS